MLVYRFSRRFVKQFDCMTHVHEHALALSFSDQRSKIIEGIKLHCLIPAGCTYRRTTI